MIKKIVSLGICILLFASCTNLQNTAPVTVNDTATNSIADDAAIKQAVQNMYTAIAYKRTINFDTAIAKRPFLPQASFIHFEDNDSVVVESVDKFFTGFEKLMKTNDIDFFQEEEVHGKTEHFGKLAQRFSSYKMYVNTRDTVAERGINSFQLVKTKEGWRVSSLTWNAQGKGQMLTPEYLASDNTQ